MHIFMAPKEILIYDKKEKKKICKEPAVLGCVCLLPPGGGAQDCSSRPAAFIGSSAEEPELLHKLVSFNIHD